MSKDIVNPDTFETAIGAMVPGSVIPVSISTLTPVQELLCVKWTRAKEEHGRLFQEQMDKVHTHLWGI